jgi:hypothetical protein
LLEGNSVQKKYENGETNSTEYRTWARMKTRCLNSDGRDYPNWGGRGITFCERWNEHENFLADMGRKPSPELTLERINNNGNYEPDNCCWATQQEQLHNQRARRDSAIDQNKATQIRNLYQRGIYTQAELGYLFDVNRSHIGRIVNNHNWKEPNIMKDLFS